MISSMTIPKASTAAAFTLGDASCRVQKLEGFGVPVARLLKDDFPIQHGGRMISQYYQSRRIVMGGTIVKDTIANFMSYKKELADAFTFENAEKALTINLLGGTTLSIDVIAVSELRIVQDRGMVTMALWEIELEASDPLLYGGTLNVETGGITTIGGGFAIPFTIPFAISGGITDQITCVNAGNARVFPSRVVLYGPGTDFILENRTLSQQLVYTGTIADGDYVEIDMKNRTALYNGLTNVYGNVSGHFWELVAGTNTVALTVGSGDGAATAARIEWYDAYWGV